MFSGSRLYRVNFGVHTYRFRDFRVPLESLYTIPVAGARGGLLFPSALYSFRDWIRIGEYY